MEARPYRRFGVARPDKRRNKLRNGIRGSLWLDKL
jgi:hypothetical protein